MGASTHHTKEYLARLVFVDRGFDRTFQRIELLPISPAKRSPASVRPRLNEGSIELVNSSPTVSLFWHWLEVSQTDQPTNQPPRHASNHWPFPHPQHPLDRCVAPLMHIVQFEHDGSAFEHHARASAQGHSCGRCPMGGCLAPQSPPTPAEPAPIEPVPHDSAPSALARAPSRQGSHGPYQVCMCVRLD